MIAQLDGVMTDSQLDGYPRTQTFVNIGGTDYIQTISVTRPFIVNGVETLKTYVKTFTYGGASGTSVVGISKWNLQP